MYKQTDYRFNLSLPCFLDGLDVRHGDGVAGRELLRHEPLEAEHLGLRGSEKREKFLKSKFEFIKI